MRTLGAVVALLLVVGACGSQTPNSTRDGLAPVPEELATGCPPAMDPVRFPEGDLPAGAVSVRLCPGRPIVAYDGTVYDAGIQPPADVLTSRVDQLVTAVNELGPPPEELMCAADGGPRLTYWFSYPDGDARAVTFEHFGCGLLLVGEESTRVDGARVARLFAEALLEQRATGGPPPGAGPAPACEGIWAQGTTALPAVPMDLETSTLCRDAGPYRQAPAPMPTGLVQRVEQELATGGHARRPCHRSDRPHVNILAVSVWGDRVVYPVDTCGRVYLRYTAGWPRESAGSYALSDALLAELDALAVGTPVRTEPAFTTTTPPVRPG